MTHIFQPLSRIQALYNYVRCGQGGVCAHTLTDKARIHSSVKVIGERVEHVAVFELVWLMNNPLHHLEDFLIASLVSRTT